eukprot:2197226-Pyramimonas_sp.AAC.1
MCIRDRRRTLRVSHNWRRSLTKPARLRLASNVSSAPAAPNLKHPFFPPAPLQRTLAAKLIDSGGSGSKADEVSSGTIAGTIRGLEGELDIQRRNLEFRNKQ